MSSPSAAPVHGGHLTIVTVGSQWLNLDPAGSQSGPGLLNLMFDSLFTVNAKLHVVPQLATSYNVSAGGTTTTIHLRPGVEFQDGTPLDANAVVFNLKRYMNPTSGCYTYLQPVQSITATNPSTVVVTFSKPYAAFISVLSSWNCGMMASPTAVQQEGASFGTHPVGAGPFKFQSEVLDVYVKMTRWSGYWQKGRPYLDSVEYESVGSDSSAMSALQAGNAQVFNSGATAGVTPVDVRQAKSSSKLRVQYAGSLSTSALVMNLRHPPFTNPLARKAVIEATNPKAIIKGLYFGLETPTEFPVGPSSWAWPGSKVAGYPGYHPSDARAIVKQLGGLSFTYEVVDTPSNVALASVVKDQLDAVGMHVTIDLVDFSKWLSDAITFNYQVQTVPTILATSDPDAPFYTFFYSHSPRNFQGISDPNLDKLIFEARQTLSEAQRKKLYLQAAEVENTAVRSWDYFFAVHDYQIESANVHGFPAIVTGQLNLADTWLGG
ncbi:MAG: hypothetical protein J2O39_00995 [Acidimicrobiales bacterium]|nr:hypothetical protein [Acidimicrobiales bacterium]